MADSIKSIKELLTELSPQLLSKQNVVATGIGYKRVQGKKTGDLCIICSVATKVASSALHKNDLIPSEAGGIPTDVYPTGVISIQSPPTGRFRPAPGGVSIGHLRITAGTLGCLVKKGNKVYILSNNHVLANSNQASRGDMILQPGPYDGGSLSADRIARLSDFIPIKFENESTGCRITGAVTGTFNFFARIAGSQIRIYSTNARSTGNLVDCAIAEPFSDADMKNEILEIGNITGTAEGVLGMEVKKSGRTTGFTTGYVEQVDASVRINFGAGKTALFTDQLIAGAMSQGGDSGSVVLTPDNEVVGLLFAGSTNTTVINRIQNVISEMKISLV